MRTDVKKWMILSLYREKKVIIGYFDGNDDWLGDSAIENSSIEMFPEECDRARHGFAEGIAIEIMACAGVFIIVHCDAGIR